jgi:hypothetical protein
MQYISAAKGNPVTCYGYIDANTGFFQNAANYIVNTNADGAGGTRQNDSGMVQLATINSCKGQCVVVGGMNDADWQGNMDSASCVGKTIISKDPAVKRQTCKTGS